MLRKVRGGRRAGVGCAAVAAALGAVAGAEVARGVNIVFTYNSGQSSAPTWDPSGTALMSMANNAALIWEDVIEDAGTVNVDIWWHYVGPDAKADAKATAFDGSGRPTAGFLRFDPTELWWADPTPFEDSEFDMRPKYYRDLSASEKTGGFRGSVPGVLEIGYRGETNGSDPGPVGKYDMLSTLLHELGHILGLSSTPAKTEAYDSGDFDFDFDPGLVNGNVMAARTWGVTSDVNDWGHLAATSLMFGGGAGYNFRRSISANDGFAVASAGGWTDIDLLRKEYWGGTNFSDAGNWAGAQVPDSTEDANVRNNAGTVSAFATVNMGFKNLSVYEGSSVSTSTFRLDVAATATIDAGGLASPVTRVRVATSGELEAQDLNVLGGAHLDMIGGVADVLDDARVDEDSRVTGFGTVLVAGTLRNDGLIIATNATTPLTVTAGTLNLDGSSGTLLGAEPGRVTASGGNVVLNGTMETFNGTMTIGAGRTITVNSPWTLGGGGGSFPAITFAGDLVMNGGADAASAATLAGSTATLQGAVTVSGLAVVSVPVVMEVPEVSVAAGGTLRLAGATTYDGGTYTGPGTLQQNGNATVSGNTTIGVETLDWDGTGGGTVTTVAPFAVLTINSVRIDPGVDGFDGTLTVNSGAVNVNTAAAWRMEGTVNLNKSLPAAPAALLGGSAEVVDAGVINATGGAVVASPYRFEAAAVNVASNTITFNNAFSSTAGGVLTKSGVGTMVVGSAQAHGAGATMIVTAGTLQMNSDAGSGGANLRVNVSSGAHLALGSTQRLDQLVIVTGADATLAAGAGRVLLTHTLSITGSGFLQLNDNDAVVDYAGGTPYGMIRNYLVSGYAGGNWNGAGIRSAAAAGDPNDITGLAIAENSVLGLGSFGGVGVDGTSLIIKYTYYGDANFDGRVGRDDFALVDRGRAMGLAGWVNGDFNYDNLVNAADYFLMDKAYGVQSGVLSAEFLAMRGAEFGEGYVTELVAAVPEPVGCAWLVVGGVWLMGRRCRRGRGRSAPSSWS